MMAKIGFQLKLAVILVIASAFINLVLKTLVLTNYLSSGGFNWFMALFGEFQIVIILISVFWFLTNLYFYIAFYRELEK
jgi:heme/copper-type cytochrome/quinol oxidase subunit 4